METEKIDSIEHEAVVTGIDPGTGNVQVRVLRQGECGSCPAARLCGASDPKGDTMTIRDPRPDRFSIGEKVILTGREALHRKAIMLATVFPCLILILSMVVIFILTADQTLSVVVGLSLTVLFYIILYLMRNRIAHEFTFTITKHQNSKK